MVGLGSDILANIIAAILVSILSWIIPLFVLLPFIFFKRRQLFQFFGITKKHPSFVVYLSTVFVVPGGSVDFRGMSRSFAGPAVPAAELHIIEPVARLFSNPLLNNLPSPIRKWLGAKVHWFFLPIAPVFKGSPQERGQVGQGNILIVGSQYYNSAGDLYTETCHPILQMEEPAQGKMVIRVTQGSRAGDSFEQRAGQPDDLAIVEKLYDDATNSTVFIAAGLGVVGTMGAVHFLVENWERLYKDFGTKPFALCLRFQNAIVDPSAYRKPVELSRFVGG